MHMMHVGKKVENGIGIKLKARKVFNYETLISLHYAIIIIIIIIVCMYGGKHIILIWKLH